MKGAEPGDAMRSPQVLHLRWSMPWPVVHGCTSFRFRPVGSSWPYRPLPLSFGLNPSVVRCLFLCLLPPDRLGFCKLPCLGLLLCKDPRLLRFGFCFGFRLGDGFFLLKELLQITLTGLCNIPELLRLLL